MPVSGTTVPVSGSNHNHEAYFLLSNNPGRRWETCESKNSSISTDSSSAYQRRHVLAASVVIHSGVDIRGFKEKGEILGFHADTK